MSDEKYNCYKCKLSHKKPSVVRNIQNAKGCREPTTRIPIRLHPEIDWRRCPANFTDGTVKHYINAYQLKIKGFDTIGSLANKSMKVVELLQIIDNLMAALQVKEVHGQSKSRN